MQSGVEINKNSNVVVIYPIPAMHQVSIDAGEVRISEITIYNNMGAAVYVSPGNNFHNENPVTIDVERFSDGIYFYTATTSLGQSSGKFTVTHQ